MIDFRSLIQALQRSMRLSQMYANRSDRDLYFACFVGGGTALSGLGGLLAHVFFPGYGLALGIIQGLFFVPWSALLASFLWRRRLGRELGHEYVTIYLNVEQIYIDDWNRKQRQIEASNLSAEYKEKQRLLAFDEYQRKMDALQADLWSRLTRPSVHAGGLAPPDQDQVLVGPTRYAAMIPALPSP